MYQIAQDDDGFEIASMRDSLDIEDDLEATPSNNKLRPDGGPPAYDAPAGSINRDASPLPAPVPQRPLNVARASLERETIFAVGEEDRDSDVSDDDEERQGLTDRKGG